MVVSRMVVASNGCLEWLPRMVASNGRLETCVAVPLLSDGAKGLICIYALYLATDLVASTGCIEMNESSMF